MKRFIVITSIQGITEAVAQWALKDGWKVVVVGDRRTPPVPSHSAVTYLSPEAQEKLGFRSLASTPWNSYARKNLGYLYAISQGADLIYESDDDTFPTPDWTVPPPFATDLASRPDGAVNCFRLFSKVRAWPRGFPLDKVLASFDADPIVERAEAPVEVPVWCGVINGEPDVDAVYRLTVGNAFGFEAGTSVAIASRCWCPFNSQNTFWYRDAFPLMFLPTTASFRMTDILRSYVCQAMLHRGGRHLGYFGPQVFQRRNPHDLLQDLASELNGYTAIPGYLAQLDRLVTEAAAPSLTTLYEVAEALGLVSKDEFAAIDAWSTDLRELSGNA